MNQILAKVFAGLILPALCFSFTGCKEKQESVDKGEVTLAELNRAYGSWEMVSARPLPKTVDELTNSPVLKGKFLPKPPPGKKLALDPARRQVVFADQ